MPKKVSAKSSQEFVSIKEIRNDVVVLADNSMRAVLLASSLNFALKSVDEQEAIIMQFQNFLNSLEFPIQIFIQSRNLDIRPYIALLEERYTAQITDLMKIQTREYIEFVKGFVENVNIMSKSFFVVVPYSGATIGSGRGVSGVFNKKTGQTASENRVARFEENRSQLEQRISVVEQGLSRTGVRAARLGTEELVELFYKIFNPGELGKPIPPGTQQQ